MDDWITARPRDSKIRHAVWQELRRQGLRQADVAEACGIRQPTLSAWINGRRNLSSQNLAAVLEVLGFRVLPPEAASDDP